MRKLWRQYGEMCRTKLVRDRLGVTYTEWQELGAVFTVWAEKFYEAERAAQSG